MNPSAVSRVQVARPMPEPPPVTTAIRVRHAGTGARCAACAAISSGSYTGEYGGA